MPTDIMIFRCQYCYSVAYEGYSEAYERWDTESILLHQKYPSHRHAMNDYFLRQVQMDVLLRLPTSEVSRILSLPLLFWRVDMDGKLRRSDFVPASPPVTLTPLPNPRVEAVLAEYTTW